MDYLTETEYSELIDYLIRGLQECHADDIIRQIKELETVNVIEKTKSEAVSAEQEPSNVNQTGMPSYIMLGICLSQFCLTVCRLLVLLAAVLRIPSSAP